MKIFELSLTRDLIQAGGLLAPEQFTLHACGRIGGVVDLWNFVTGREVPYLVWRHEVHLSQVGLLLLHRGKLLHTDLRVSLQEAERTPRWALYHSLRRPK